MLLVYLVVVVAITIPDHQQILMLHLHLFRLFNILHAGYYSSQLSNLTSLVYFLNKKFAYSRQLSIFHQDRLVRFPQLNTLSHI